MIVCCFLAYTFILWVTNAGLYFAKMSLYPSSVVQYYLGDEERYLQPRSFTGMLEVLHFHSFSMGILLLTLTHLLLFVPISPRTKLRPSGGDQLLAIRPRTCPSLSFIIQNGPSRTI